MRHWSARPGSRQRHHSPLDHRKSPRTICALLSRASGMLAPESHVLVAAAHERTRFPPFPPSVIRKPAAGRIRRIRLKGDGVRKCPSPPRPTCAPAPNGRPALPERRPAPRPPVPPGRGRSAVARADHAPGHLVDHARETAGDGFDFSDPRPPGDPFLARPGRGAPTSSAVAVTARTAAGEAILERRLSAQRPHGALRAVRRHRRPPVQRAQGAAPPTRPPCSQGREPPTVTGRLERRPPRPSRPSLAEED